MNYGLPLEHVVAAESSEEPVDAGDLQIIDYEESAVPQVWVEKCVLDMGKRESVRSVEQDRVEPLREMVFRKRLLRGPLNKLDRAAPGIGGSHTAKYLKLVESKDAVVRTMPAKNERACAAAGFGGVARTQGFERVG